MTGYVVDASVAAKWLVSEPLSEQASALLEAEQMLVAPDLLFAEVTNALWAMCRRGDISRTDFAEAVAVLRSAPVACPAPMRQLAAAAAKLATDLDHPAYDCFYLALALQQQDPVVTADRRFYNIVRRHPYLADWIVHLEDLCAK